MPTIRERLEERDPGEMLALARHTLGFVELGGETCVIVELTARSPKHPAMETRTFVMSLAGAVALVADLTNMVESDAGILALVHSTLRDARAMKACESEFAYDASIRDHRCATCRATGRSQFAQPCPDCAVR